MRATQNSLTSPSLIAMNSKSGALESWPLNPKGGMDPEPISKPLGIAVSGGMAGNGNVIAITDEYPAQIVLYNVSTKSKSTLPDPFGVPIDIAMDKNAALYVINIARNVGNVTMYPAGSPVPKKLVCKYLTTPEAIALDNEGDIFVNGYLSNNLAGVVEIPNGPGGPDPDSCVQLHLRAEPGYVAGLAVDPKTDDLIVLDDPDDCAGGIEGRMTVYPKPYSPTTAQSHDLGANCAGGLRLNANSTAVFVGDQDVSGSFSFILQRGFPNGSNFGIYHGGSPGGFTTIPNTLPN
jgi:hypothetical protein